MFCMCRGLVGVKERYRTCQILLSQLDHWSLPNTHAVHTDMRAFSTCTLSLAATSANVKLLNPDARPLTGLSTSAHCSQIAQKDHKLSVKTPLCGCHPSYGYFPHQRPEQVNPRVPPPVFSTMFSPGYPQTTATKSFVTIWPKCKPGPTAAAGAPTNGP